jgi:hypothetical protein
VRVSVRGGRIGVIGIEDADERICSFVLLNKEASTP